MALYLGYIFIFSLTACTGLKNIKSSDPLLASSKIEYKSKLNKTHRREVRNELYEVNTPRPNGKFLWMRPALSIYNFMGNPKKEKGLRAWIKRKIGKPPVRITDVNPENIVRVFGNRLFNYGYFNAEVSFEIDSNKKVADIKYYISPKNNYIIDSVMFPEKTDEINSEIAESSPGTVIKKNESYELGILVSELDRIDTHLKDSGYYYFDKNNLKFRADTSLNKNKVNLLLYLKPGFAPEVIEKMKIGDILIHDEFTTENYLPDTMYYEGITYLSRAFRTRPEIILNQIRLRKGDYYSRSLHFRSLNHLSSLGIYRLVNVNFIKDSIENTLYPHLYMSLQPKNSVAAELNAVVRTTNYTGPGINLSWKNRNLFRGAETLSINLNGSFEVQIGADSINTSFEWGLDAELDFPRLIPFKMKKKVPEFIPITKIKAGARLFRRVELYTLASFYSQFGYRWRQTRVIKHELQSIDVSFNKVTDQTQAFRDYLEANPIVKRSFEEQFIIGTSYSFTYDNLIEKKNRNIYFNTTVESAGFLISLLYNTFKGRLEQPEDQHKLFGVPYSQFIKFRNELRNYFKIGRNSQLVTRGIIGIGIPYGNSNVIPYVRQFFAGGTNDLRAFVSRTVGPGSFNPPVENLGIDQTGDIKLAANVEYRFSFTRLLKGAIFIDAGNVWLKNDDPERPGSSFEFNRFYKEIAIGNGIGLRIDANFVVFRIDLAWAIYRPNLPAGERWVIDRFNPFNSNWRRNNLVINVAIGYPF